MLFGKFGAARRNDAIHDHLSVHIQLEAKSLSCGLAVLQAAASLAQHPSIVDSIGRMADAPLAQFREVRLDEDQWWHSGNALLEPDNFLLSLKKNEPRSLRPKGKAVVFIKQGYLKQLSEVNSLSDTLKANVQLPVVEPRWTSFQLRQQQSLGLAGRSTHKQSYPAAAYGLTIPRSGYAAATTLGAIEHCLITDVQYLRVVPPGATTQQVLEATQVQAAVQDEHTDTNMNGIVPRKGYFVRVFLQKMQVTQSARHWKHDKLTPLPLMTTVEFYLEKGACGEFIVDRSRYMRATNHNWQKNDSFRMFWANPENPAVGDFYKGKIVADLAKDAADPESRASVRKSHWERYKVRWDEYEEEVDAEMHVNAWEISLPEDELVLRNGGNYDIMASSAEDISDEASSDNDDPGWNRHRGRRHRRRRQNTSRRQTPPVLGRKRRHSSTNQDSDYEAASQEEEDDQAAPTTGNGRRVAAKQLPTLLISKSRKLDWNSSSCCFCYDGGDLIECDGTCLRSFHQECLEKWMPGCNAPPEGSEDKFFCSNCMAGQGDCVVCGAAGIVGTEVFKCKMGSCGLYYHPRCLAEMQPHMFFKIDSLRYGDASQLSADMLQKDVGKGTSFTCPAHFCLSCHMSGDAIKMYRCFLCPRAYHGGCVPKGGARVQGDGHDKSIECPWCHLYYREEREAQVAAKGLGRLSWEETATHLDLDKLNALVRHHLREPHHLRQRILQEAAQERLAAASTTAAKRAQRQASAARVMAPAAAAAPLVLQVKPLTDGGEPKVLAGKGMWHFGKHAKGGGCDFKVAVDGVKLHTKIVLDLHGTVTIRPLHTTSEPLLINGEAVPAKGVQLQVGDVIRISSHSFKVEQAPEAAQAAAAAAVAAAAIPPPLPSLPAGLSALAGQQQQPMRAEPAARLRVKTPATAAPAAAGRSQGSPASNGSAAERSDTTAVAAPSGPEGVNDEVSGRTRTRLGETAATNTATTSNARPATGPARAPDATAANTKVKLGRIAVPPTGSVGQPLGTGMSGTRVAGAHVTSPGKLQPPLRVKLGVAAPAVGGSARSSAQRPQLKIKLGGTLRAPSTSQPPGTLRPTQPPSPPTDGATTPAPPGKVRVQITASMVTAGPPGTPTAPPQQALAATPSPASGSRPMRAAAATAAKRILLQATRSSPNKQPSVLGKRRARSPSADDAALAAAAQAPVAPGHTAEPAGEGIGTLQREPVRLHVRLPSGHKLLSKASGERWPDAEANPGLGAATVSRDPVQHVSSSTGERGGVPSSGGQAMSSGGRPLVVKLGRYVAGSGKELAQHAIREAGNSRPSTGPQLTAERLQHGRGAVRAGGLQIPPAPSRAGGTQPKAGGRGGTWTGGRLHPDGPGSRDAAPMVPGALPGSAMPAPKTQDTGQGARPLWLPARAITAGRTAADKGARLLPVPTSSTAGTTGTLRQATRPQPNPLTKTHHAPPGAAMAQRPQSASTPNHTQGTGLARAPSLPTNNGRIYRTASLQQLAVALPTSLSSQPSRDPNVSPASQQSTLPASTHHSNPTEQAAARARQPQPGLHRPDGHSCMADSSASAPVAAQRAQQVPLSAVEAAARQLAAEIGTIRRQPSSSTVHEPKPARDSAPAIADHGGGWGAGAGTLHAVQLPMEEVESERPGVLRRNQDGVQPAPYIVVPCAASGEPPAQRSGGRQRQSAGRYITMPAALASANAHPPASELVTGKAATRPSNSARAQGTTPGMGAVGTAPHHHTVGVQAHRASDTSLAAPHRDPAHGSVISYGTRTLRSPADLAPGMLRHEETATGRQACRAVAAEASVLQPRNARYTPTSHATPGAATNHYQQQALMQAPAPNISPDRDFLADAFCVAPARPHLGSRPTQQPAAPKAAPPSQLTIIDLTDD